MKIFVGRVVSNKTQKTAIVEIERYRVHPIYKKRTKRTKRYPVHDLVNTKVGNIVEFIQTRPISKTKKWTITKVL